MATEFANDPSEVASNRRWLGLGIRIVVSAGILTWLAGHVDWSHIANSFRELRWGWWLAALGLHIACQLLCSVRWMLLSRPLEFEQSISRFTRLYFVGMFFNLFLPTSIGGDAVRAIYLANGSGKRMAALFSVFLDRASGLVVLIGLACLAAAVSPVALPVQLSIATWGIAVAAGVGLACLPWIIKLATRQRSRKIRTLAQMMSSYHGNAALIVETALISIVVQVLNAVLVMLIGWALQMEVPPVFYALAAPMVTLFTLIPISLNGMGLREGAMVLFLAPAGVATGDAVSLAFLWFLAQSAASLLGAIVFLVGRLSHMEVPTGERSALDHRSAEGRTGQCRDAA